MARIAEHEMVLVPGRINKVNREAERVQIILTDGQILFTSFENLPDYELPEMEPEEVEETTEDPEEGEDPVEEPPVPEATLLSEVEEAATPTEPQSESPPETEAAAEEASNEAEPAEEAPEPEARLLSEVDTSEQQIPAAETPSEE